MWKYYAETQRQNTETETNTKMLQQASNYSYCAIDLHFWIEPLKKQFDNFEDAALFSQSMFS